MAQIHNSTNCPTVLATKTLQFHFPCAESRMEEASSVIDQTSWPVVAIERRQKGSLVEQIVSGHRLLPEKATSFQPKPGLGVLMRSLLDE